MRKFNTNKGITLIALIITIIVMLILVSVTITISVNGGLFGHAQIAARKTNNAMADEQALGNGTIKIGNNEYNSPQEYVNIITGGNSGNSGNTGGNLTLTINGESEVAVTQTITLTLKDSKGNTISDNITWTSSNETAATVANGVVTGLKAAKENENVELGKTTITATYNGKIATKEIMIKPFVVLCKTCSGHGNVYKGLCPSCGEYTLTSRGYRCSVCTNWFVTASSAVMPVCPDCSGVRDTWDMDECWECGRAYSGTEGREVEVGCPTCMGEDQFIYEA